MRVQFIKNIHFTKLLKINGRLREFNFRKLSGLQDGIFTIDVVDDRGNRIMFRMQKEENGWRIVPQPLPEWVNSSERLLSDMIEEELQQA